MRKIVNGLTLARIGLALALFFPMPLSPAYLVLYLLAGFTDIADGWLARITGTCSTSGAKLDSAADTVMAGALLATLYPAVPLCSGMLLWIAAIALLRLASVLTAVHRFGTYASIHTYGNKATGLALFLTPLALLLGYPGAWIGAVCLLATLSAAEEWLIMATSKEPELNQKSWFLPRSPR